MNRYFLFRSKGLAPRHPLGTSLQPFTSQDVACGRRSCYWNRFATRILSRGIASAGEGPQSLQN